MSPIIFGVFVCDRILLALFPWVRIQTVREWAVDDSQISYSFIRVLGFIIIASFIKLVLL